MFWSSIYSTEATSLNRSLFPLWPSVLEVVNPRRPSQGLFFVVGGNVKRTNIALVALCLGIPLLPACAKALSVSLALRLQPVQKYASRQR
jgi:hypothetical protein